MLNSLTKLCHMQAVRGSAGGIRIHTGYIKLYLRTLVTIPRASLASDCRRISPAMGGHLLAFHYCQPYGIQWGDQLDTVGVHTGYDNYPANGSTKQCLDKD